MPLAMGWMTTLPPSAQHYSHQRAPGHAPALADGAPLPPAFAAVLRLYVHSTVNTVATSMLNIKLGSGCAYWSFSRLLTLSRSCFASVDAEGPPSSSVIGCGVGFAGSAPHLTSSSRPRASSNLFGFGRLSRCRMSDSAHRSTYTNQQITA